MAYLDATADTDRGAIAPQEELERWLAEQGHHIADLERALPPEPSTLVSGKGALTSAAARDLAMTYLATYRSDAERLPLAAMRSALEETGPDPAAIAQAHNVDLACVFRRLATLPKEILREDVGLAVCDASGTLTFRKPIDGFTLPRFGAACPLLPLYQALGRPMSPVRALVEQAARTPRTFLTYSIAQPAHPAGFEQPTVFEATMLILDAGPGAREPGTTIPIGPTCRICPRLSCSARREPTILSA